jgi:hypothetical protein
MRQLRTSAAGRFNLPDSGCNLRSFGFTQEHAMAKGQMRPSKEKKKPKADHNKDKKKGGLAPHLVIQQGGGQQGSNPFKKT